MNILAVDTTSENMVIAISKNDVIFSRIGMSESKKHNSQILPMIDELLEEAKITLGEIDYLACVVGPGSFTGIRIGVSSVNALAFALSKKCVSITALEELAFGVSENDFYCAIDCRHDNYYYARFNNDYKNMKELGEITLQDLEKKDKVIYKDKPSDPNALIEIAKYKIGVGKFETLSPLYLKKSQAEREYENKNMDKIV
ncbi:MAG: tRNA (adenosine(37)-N6)-threonylcarbamoyltransferase complex dimerization subunit type 1 TsaB [Clostridiales bacterium]|nr:tRNA (adenosine(37)-N6)-threonylcarbamoyltransferase complex dimerization subunit type 1 TsaB [Clostridiales bacterium]